MSASRRLFFWMNLGVVALFILLIEPLYFERSMVPVVLGLYSVRYALYLGALASAVTLYLAAALKGDEGLNRYLFICALTVCVLFEGAARLIDRRGAYSSD